MNYIKALENPIFRIIAQASKQQESESYVIGGFVRDYLLQRDFKKDIDIVTIGSGIDLALKVSELLPSTPKVQVFKNYGTAMLRYKEIDIEFVGARKESYSEDSRNPVVENGTLQEDQNRRDFTEADLAEELSPTRNDQLPAIRWRAAVHEAVQEGGGHDRVAQVATPVLDDSVGRDDDRT